MPMLCHQRFCNILILFYSLLDKNEKMSSSDPYFNLQSNVLILHHNKLIQEFGFKNNRFCSINNTKSDVSRGS